MATEVFDFEGAGERYKFLLQPVKDLAKNWDMDIAKTLEDYIQKVVDENDSAVLVDRNGRRKVFNFAEAAMLIHGTTTVYVRKVEYVHQCALNFFDQLKEEKTHEKKRQKGMEAEEEDGEANEDGGEDGEPGEFGLLGQRKNKKTKVNYAAMRALLESDKHAPTLPMVPIAFVPLADFEKTDVPLYTRTNNKDQIGKKDDFRVNTCHIYDSLALIDLKHISLVDKFVQQPRNTTESHRLTDGAGCPLETLMERTVEDEMESGLNLTEPGHSGSANQNDEQQLADHENPLANLDGDVIAGGGAAFDGLENGDFGENDHTLVDQQQQAVEADWLDGVDPGMGVDEDEIIPETPQNMSSTLNEGEVGREQQNSLAQTTAHALMRGSSFDPLRPSTQLGNSSRPITGLNDLRETNGRRNSNNPQQEADWEELMDDELDPQEMVTEQSKPYRKKENCVILAANQIKAREKRLERECLAKGVPNERSVKSYIDTHMYSRRIKKRSFAFGQFNPYLMDQAISALNLLLFEEEKRRSELRKKRLREHQTAEREARAAARRRTSQRELDPVLDHPPDEEDENEAPQEVHENGLLPGAAQEEEQEEEYEDIMDEILIPDIEDLGSQDDDDNHTNLGDILDIEDLQNPLGGIRNMYAGFDHIVSSKPRDRNILSKVIKKQTNFFICQLKMRNAYDDTIVMDADFNPEDLPERPPSQMDYDEIIAFHLQKYWIASEEAMTKCSERVQMWEAKMAAALEEEQKHREFDTRQYGDELLNKFDGQVGTEIDFTQMLGSVPNEYDRSRYLLVSLILANMGNLEIEVTEKAAINSMGRQAVPDEGADLEDASGSDQADVDKIRVKLLKLERHHQVFEDEQRLLEGNPLN